MSSSITATGSGTGSQTRRVPIVFVVESNPEVRGNIVDLIEEEGYLVRATSGLDDYVEQIWVAMPDVIVCDTAGGSDGGLGVLTKTLLFRP